MKIRQSIERKLKSELSPEYLEVIDQSHLHEGHAGHNPGGESHFKLVISASKLEGLTRIEKHKIIHKILDEELKKSIHALSITFV